MALSGRTVQSSGDYNIKTGEGSTILLDTGPNVGEVRITGNLIVLGETLTVEATNLNVQDNIIILNYGETGQGVTLGYSGVQIDRGYNIDSSQVAPTALLWDEANETWQIAQGTPEDGFNYTDSKLKLSQILTDAATDDGDLILIGAGTGVVKVTGTVNYEQRVLDDDDVPNKRYVDDAIQLNPTFQITKDDTRVIVFDKENALPAASFSPAIGPYIAQPVNSQIAFIVDNRRVAVMTKDHFEMTGLTIFTEDPVVPDVEAAMSGNFNPGPISTNLTGFENQSAVVIQSDNTNANIRLETNGTGKVVISYAMSFEYHGSPVTQVGSTSILYGSTPGTGTTGLSFRNTRPSKELNGTVNASFTTDELISKNRALLFSMLF
jgi:hypothetical protein